MNTKFRFDHKQPNVTSVKQRQKLVASVMQTQRENKRENIFNKLRLGTTDEDEISLERTVKDVRSRQLEAWKRTREEAKKSETKRKPFIVSTVHHSVGSPYKQRSPFKLDTKPKTMSSKKKDIVLAKPATAAGRVTRAMSRAAKVNVTVVVQKKNELPKLAPANFKFKAPKGIAPLPMSSHKQQRELKIVLTPFAMEKMDEQMETFSTPPSVTKRSGKKGSTKKASTTKASTTKESGKPQSTKRKLNYTTPKQKVASLVVEAVPSVQKTDVSKYRKELDTVIEQLENLCSKWSFMQEQCDNLPNEVNDMMDVATGQTKLLIKEKLAQYRGLIDECEKNSGPVIVTESDLQGFWEMVNIQVQNVISKFEKLDVLKDNNWVEPQKQHKSPLKKKTGGSKISKKKQIAAKSNVRDHIAALRRAKATMECSEPKDADATVDTPSKGETKSNQRGNCTPVVALIRAQLSEKQKRNSRCSTALMTITNHFKDIGTPETGKKINTKAADGEKSSKRVSNRMKRLTSGVMDDKQAEFELHFTGTPSAKTYGKSPKKSAEVPEDDKEFDLLKKTPTFLHSSPTTETPKEINEGTPRSSRRRNGNKTPK